MHSRGAFLFLTLALLALNGCCTIAVRNIGVESELVRRCENVSVGMDGGIAVVVNSVVHKEGPLSQGYIHNKRIIVGSPEVVKRSVTHHSRRDKGTLSVHVDIVDRGLDGWHMLPYLAYKNDSSFRYLPDSFQNGSTTYNSCGFRYIIDGKFEDVYFGQFSFYEDGIESPKRINTKFWHYPSQVLLIPAFVFDVATAPIQLIIIGHEVGTRNNI